MEDIHREHYSKLYNKEQKPDEHWFDEVDQEISTFKHSVHKYLLKN